MDMAADLAEVEWFSRLMLPFLRAQEEHIELNMIPNAVHRFKNVDSIKNLFFLPKYTIHFWKRALASFVVV